MSDSQEDIQAAVRAWLNSVAEKAREDSRKGESDIGSIYRQAEVNFNSLSDEDIDQMTQDIVKAASTKEGARRIMNAVATVAKVIVKLYA